MNDELIENAEEHLTTLKNVGIRASIDSLSGKLGAKIRKAETDKIPHMLILGKELKKERFQSVPCQS